MKTKGELLITINEILEQRLCEIGESLEVYKEISKEDEDEQDTIVDLCLEALGL